MAECALGAGTEHSGVSVAMRLSTAKQPAADSPAGAMLLLAPGKLLCMAGSPGTIAGLVLPTCVFTPPTAAWAKKKHKLV